MKICSACKIEKPKAEFHRSKDAKDGVVSRCKICVKAYGLAYRFGNAESIRERDRLRGQNPKRRASQKQKMQESYNANRLDRLASAKRYVTEHPNQVRAYKQAYKARNPGKVLSDTRRRQARKLNAAPAWANQFFIEEI